MTCSTFGKQARPRHDRIRHAAHDATSGCVNAKGIAMAFWRESIDVGDGVSGLFHQSRDEE
jgi:hypothetical protein